MIPKFRSGVFFVLIFCQFIDATQAQITEGNSGVYAIVLGIVQDAGAPQLACQKECCTSLSDADRTARMVSCIAIFDRADSTCYLLDATPDIASQMLLYQQVSGLNKLLPDGIFLTHAHIGHYTGLMYLGREAAGTREMPVYAMPRMTEFLMTNAPWSMLHSLRYIQLNQLEANSPINLSEDLSITPIPVPHRDEFSETVGFRVDGPEKSLLFIPDIDKWERWPRNINELVKDVDIAFLDGTFYDNTELPGRDMSEIPHPFIVESMKRFDSLSNDDKNKVHFIHLNHTNPALNANSKAAEQVTKAGYHVAVTGEIIPL